MNTPDISVSAKKNVSFIGVSLPEISTIHHINNRIFSGIPERHFRESIPVFDAPGQPVQCPGIRGENHYGTKNQNAFFKKKRTGPEGNHMQLPFRTEQFLPLMIGKQKAHIEYSLPPISYGTGHEK